MGRLPNLVVIGGLECGTTSLHYYLDQHPEISMSKRKELHYFSRPDWRERTAWYGSSSPGWTLRSAARQRPVTRGIRTSAESPSGSTR